jgi:hypothetical protein
MKYLYADTQDYVDPEYDFINDRNAPGRERYWDDQYPHELMDPAPYDGLLVAMSAVRQAEGVASSKVRYSTKEEQRLLREGARKFLRFGGPAFQNKMLMGDCGAFAYVEHDTPAFPPAEVVEFYTDCGFTHGVSPDHIIFDCDTNNPSPREVSAAVRARYDITLVNAESFLQLVRAEGLPFEPMGAVQGWSPQSMALAAKKLEAIGYRYLAIGGLVPLKVDVIHQVLRELRQAIRPETNIHLLGFAKANHIHNFVQYNITSFDSTSPLIKAFMDSKNNYFLPTKEGGIAYYTAIRIPQALENTRLMQGIKRGIFSAEDIYGREQKALGAVRQYDKGVGSADGVLNAVMDYHQFLVRGEAGSTQDHDKSLSQVATLIRRTLEDKPWKQCSCSVCRAVGVEVIIFRASNRNKRRGFHNLGVYHQYIQRILGSQP